MLLKGKNIFLFYNVLKKDSVFAYKLKIVNNYASHGSIFINL